MTRRNPIICGKCGKKVFPYCTNPECEKWREEIAQQTIRECFAVMGGLAERLFKQITNTAGTQGDYQEIKKVQEKISKLAKERKWNSFIESDIEELKKSCRDLAEEYISPKDRDLVDNRGKISINKICCRAGQIKKDKDGYFYCDYCWETESPKFLQSLKSHLLDEFNKIYLREKSSFDFKSSSNYRNLLENQFTTQEEFRRVYQELEKELRENGKESPINNNPNNQQREREQDGTNSGSQKEQLQQAINNLTNKPNRTPEEEQDLINKKKDLENLNNQNSEQSKDKNNWLKPALIIGTITIIAIVLIYLIAKPKKKQS